MQQISEGSDLYKQDWENSLSRLLSVLWRYRYWAFNWGLMIFLLRYYKKEWLKYWTTSEDDALCPFVTNCSQTSALETCPKTCGELLRTESSSAVKKEESNTKTRSFFQNVLLKRTLSKSISTCPKYQIFYHINFYWSYFKLIYGCLIIPSNSYLHITLGKCTQPSEYYEKPSYFMT